MNIEIGKDDFYVELIKMAGRAERSIKFYSISCCFGFYSFGLTKFEDVYNALKKALAIRHQGRYIDTKIIVDVDYDNPIDLFAAKKLIDLENRFAAIPNHHNSTIFREMPNGSPMVQFLIVDDNELLYSEVQHEEYITNLGMVVNLCTKAACYAAHTGGATEISAAIKLFDETWRTGDIIEIPPSKISKATLEVYLRSFVGISRVKTERELQLMLLGYLAGRHNPAVVQMEHSVGSTRIDLAIGGRPANARVGIEVKYGIDDGEVRNLIGQIIEYRKEYDDVILVIGNPNYTPQRRRELLLDLVNIGVSVIELEK